MKQKTYKRKKSITKHGAPRYGTYISKDRKYYPDKTTGRYDKRTSRPSLLSRLFRKKK